MYYNIITYNLKSGHLVLYVFSQLGVANVLPLGALVQCCG